MPKHYIRKQTLSNAERFITQELKDFESKILGAQEKIQILEYDIFSTIRNYIRERLGKIQQTAEIIATLDVISSLSEAAVNYNYVRPEIFSNEQGLIKIKDGRHPVVERVLNRDLFVPNDTKIDHSDCEIMLITGPNMAGSRAISFNVAGRIIYTGSVCNDYTSRSNIYSNRC